MKKYILLLVSIIFICGCSKPISKTLEVKNVEARQKNVQSKPTLTPTVTLKPTVQPTVQPTSTPKPTNEIFVVKENITSSSALAHNTDYSSNTKLSNVTKGWYFNRNSNHNPPTAQKEIDINKYGGYYLGNINEKVVYLTFDQGYENGYTNKILDVLKEKDVKAAFFLTKPYIKNNPDILKRMIADGHILANHSVTHPSLPSLSDEKIIFEIEEVDRYLKELTGYSMDKFFRPPMGEYSQRTLAITNDLGYKTIFWSFAYKDWLVDDQPTKSVAHKTVLDNLHNGSIILLHSVSSANTDALPDIIDSIKKQDYKFGSLYQLGN